MGQSSNQWQRLVAAGVMITGSLTGLPLSAGEIQTGRANLEPYLPSGIVPETTSEMFLEKLPATSPEIVPAIDLASLQSAIQQSVTTTTARLKQTTPTSDVLLDVEGSLEDGDTIFGEDNQRIDIYAFQSEVGQVVTLRVIVDGFTPFALMIDTETGETIATTPAALLGTTTVTVTLPNSGEYRVGVVSTEIPGEGSYRLTVTSATATAGRQAEADRLLQQGIQQFRISQFREALASWEQALALYREIDDRAGEGRALGNLGAAYVSLGQYERAIDFYEQSLAIAREIGDRAGEGGALNNLGIAYENLGQYERAIDFYEQSLAIAREIGDRFGEGRALNNLGSAYTSLGQYERAIDFSEQRLAIAREIGDRAGEGGALNNLGNAYRRLGQYERAIDFYEQSLAIAREIGDRAGEGTALGNLGIAHNNLGQYERAIDFHEQSLAIAREIGDRSREGGALGGLGIAYASLGQYERAIDFTEQSLAIARDIGDRAGEGGALGNLGASYLSLGQYERAIDFTGQWLAIARDIGDPVGEGVALNNLGEAYRNLGQYERAINFYEQSLAIAREISDRAGEGRALGNLGNAYLSLGQYERAINLYEQRLAIAREIGDRSGEGDALGNLGAAHLSLGQHERAIDFSEQLLAIAREIGDRSGEGSALGNLGNAYARLNQYERAIDFHEQFLAIAREIGDRAGEGNALNNLGVAYLNTNQFSTAETMLVQSMEVYETLRVDLSDDQLITIADTQSRTYANLELALIAQNKTTQALTITERGRAQAFALQLALRQNNTPDNIATTPITYPTLTDIQRIAREQNATLVSYSLIFNQALYIWVVSPTGDIQFRSVDFEGDGAGFNPIATIDGPVYRGESDPSELDTLVADSRAGIGVVGGLPQERLKALHQVLIDPIADLLPTDPEANVVFIPQGSLFLVPFAALQDGDGTYLIAKHTITTAPSIQVLGLAAESVTPTAGQPFNNPLIVGNPLMPSIPDIPLAPLPGAETEAVAIAALFNLSPLLGEQATEAQIKAQMPTAQLIHLATHGLLDYSSSQFEIPGALALTPGNGEDGLLTAGEILDMDLQAQLVILSACDTGRGQITGDGVVGLSRSLITAGVPSVVVSLWAVPDAPTAELMTAFYQQLSQGQTKAQALRQAMLQMLERYPAPKNWAAFTLTGAAH